MTDCSAYYGSQMAVPPWTNNYGESHPGNYRMEYYPQGDNYHMSNGISVPWDDHSVRQFTWARDPPTPPRARQVQVTEDYPQHRQLNAYAFQPEQWDARRYQEARVRPSQLGPQALGQQALGQQALGQQSLSQPSLSQAAALEAYNSQHSQHSQHYQQRSLRHSALPATSLPLSAQAPGPLTTLSQPPPVSQPAPALPAAPQAAPKERQREERQREEKPKERLRCEKCDGDHATEDCPFFKQPREKHEDAWQNYSGATKAQLAKPLRECIAPKSLTHHQVRSVRMPGDGSCLFHSIAFGLNNLGYSEAGTSVRKRVANFIADRPDFEITGTPLRSWVEWDSQMTVSSYASRLQAGNCWGGAIEMAACSQIYAIDVAVYEEDCSGGFCRISDFITDKKPYGAVLVLYTGRCHYDALQVASPHDTGTGYRGYSTEYATSQGGGEQEDDEWGCSLM